MANQEPSPEDQALHIVGKYIGCPVKGLGQGITVPVLGDQAINIGLDNSAHIQHSQ